MNLVTTKSAKYNYRQVHKFGGSSLANAKCYQRVANIMAKHSQPGDLIVVSASGTTTNQLINWLKLSKTDRILANLAQQLIRHYQQNLINSLLSNTKSEMLKLAFLSDLNHLISLIDKSIYNEIYAEFIGYGEIWSARLMSAVLEEFGLPSQWLDARLFLRAEFSIQPQVDETISRPLLQQILEQYPNKRLVVTGFIAQDKQGKTVLLGRNGSDYSATQVGALAMANKVTIWSDVAGIYSADPKKVKDAYLLPFLQLDEANELARLTASVLHTRTLQPISIANIDLQLKCSYHPEHGSTKIKRILTLNTGIKTITSHNNICLVELNLINQKTFNQIYEDIHFLLIQKQLQPLAIGLHPNKKLIQLCYTSEIAIIAISALKKIKSIEKLSLRNSFSLIALIGSGIGKDPIYSYYFHKQLKNQPVEFIWFSKEKISLIAVLRITKISHLIRGLHHNFLILKNF